MGWEVVGFESWERILGRHCVQLVDGLIARVDVVKDGKSVRILDGGMAVVCVGQSMVEFEDVLWIFSLSDQEAGNSCTSQMCCRLGMNPIKLPFSDMTSRRALGCTLRVEAQF